MEAFLAMLLMLSICPTKYVTAETFYIVTTSSSYTSCPGEFDGEPCLTLQQYVTTLKYIDNITFLLEHGTHRLRQSAVLFKSGSYDNIYSFKMIAENAQIILYNEFSLIDYHYRSLVLFQDVHISGITFTGTGYGSINMRYIQNAVIEDCQFQGVRLRLYSIMNATIIGCCFFNYSSGAALYSTSSSVTIIRSEFSSNEQALYISLYWYKSLIVNESLFINNSGHPTVHISGGESVIISNATFVNNTCTTRNYNGGALYISGSGESLLVTDSIFINNTVTTGEGGALYLAGKFNNASITKSTFIYNSASYSSCGAISVTKNLHIKESAFYYNRANGDGGVACVRSADITVSKSTLVQNNAAGNGGVLLLDNSTVCIDFTLFKNNRAGQDGGAVATYLYPSTYTIYQCTFIDNYAKDDGGAVFIGCAESDLRIEECIFSNNHANDRGGAITIYGSTLSATATSVYNNKANLGNSMCACSSEVNTPFSDGQRDSTQPECTNYDTNINYHDLPTVQEQGYPDIIHLSTKNGGTCPLIDNSLHGELRKANITAYTAVTISVTLALAMLLYIVITKAFRYHMTQRAQTSEGVALAGDQVDPLYEEPRNYTASKADTRDIEMIPNVVYGKHTTN